MTGQVATFFASLTNCLLVGYRMFDGRRAEADILNPEVRTSETCLAER